MVSALCTIDKTPFTVKLMANTPGKALLYLSLLSQHTVLLYSILSMTSVIKEAEKQYRNYLICLTHE